MFLIGVPQTSRKCVKLLFLLFSCGTKNASENSFVSKSVFTHSAIRHSPSTGGTATHTYPHALCELLNGDVWSGIAGDGRRTAAA